MAAFLRTTTRPMASLLLIYLAVSGSVGATTASSSSSSSLSTKTPSLSWTSWVKSLVSASTPGPPHAEAYGHLDAYFTADLDDEDWYAVDEDFSWDRRRTGVTRTWRSGSGIWIHYDYDGFDALVPWTQGHMIKFLRQKSKTSFQLHSAYEPGAAGKWEKFMSRRSQGDGLLEHKHTFYRTPYRVTVVPKDLIVEEHKDNSEDMLVSRATIVQPDGATVSGPRSIGDALQSGELWVAETINGQPEAVKTGIFFYYNTDTGDLIEAFRMHEVATEGRIRRPWWRRLFGRPALTPYQKLNCTAIREKVTHDPEVAICLPMEGWVADYDDDDGNSILPISDLVGSLLRRRIVRTFPPHDGVEEAVELGPREDIFYEDMDDGYGGSVDDSGLYWTHRFDDGMFIRLPKNILNIPNDAPVCMELGCWRCDGNYHRVLLYGSKDTGGLHTAVYDEWEGLP